MKKLFLRLRPFLLASGLCSLARRMALNASPPNRLRLSRIIDPTGASGIILATFDGGKISVNPAESLGRQIAYNLGDFERFELELFRNLLRPDDTVLDIGANIGLYSLVAAKRLTTGTLHAFEPNPDASCLLIRNLAPFVGKRVRIHPVTVGAEVGSVDFICAADSAFSSVVETNRSRSVQHVLVAQTTVDEIVAQHQLVGVNLIKLDVEGYEPEVLRGAITLLSKSDAPLLLMEIARPNLEPRGLTQLGVVESLESLGYEVLVAQTNLPRARDLNWNLGWVDRENFLAAKPCHAERLKGWRR